MRLTDLLEALNTDMNEKLNRIQREIETNNILSPYLLDVMPYVYKKGYSINVMMNTKFRRLKEKQSIIDVLRDISKRNNAKLKSIDEDQVYKIYI